MYLGQCMQMQADHQEGSKVRTTRLSGFLSVLTDLRTSSHSANASLLNSSFPTHSHHLHARPNTSSPRNP
jgi:hypothetical protein